VQCDGMYKKRYIRDKESVCEREREIDKSTSLQIRVKMKLQCKEIVVVVCLFIKKGKVNKCL
jgi:hypothetical protein